ncbi:MAG TPA: hypothetical protein VHB25_10535 [Gemmatimonadaceae bacterium]|nr:hypothetical protein [Gemmatimonadaceae bacterium]
MPRLLHSFLALAVAAASAAAQSASIADTGHELVLSYGPLTLPARTSHDQMVELPTLTLKIPADGWLHGIDVDIVDAHGRVLPRTLLHHLTAIEPDQRDLFNPGMMRIGAAGAETGAVTMPWFIGLPVHRGDSVFIRIMLSNATDTAYDHITLRARAPFTHAHKFWPVLSIYPLDAAIGPKDKPNVFDLPPGRSEHYWEGTPAVSGRVLALMGHLHRYGVLLRFEDRTTHTVLWEARPTRDSTGEILSMPMSTFLWRLGKPIDSSHVYRLTAIYDNPTGQTIPDGGMGVLAGVMFLSGHSWPKIDRTDPAYLNDLRETLQGSQMGEMAHMQHSTP